MHLANRSVFVYDNHSKRNVIAAHRLGRAVSAEGLFGVRSGTKRVPLKGYARVAIVCVIESRVRQRRSGVQKSDEREVSGC